MLRQVIQEEESQTNEWLLKVRRECRKWPGVSYRPQRVSHPRIVGEYRLKTDVVFWNRALRLDFEL